MHDEPDGLGAGGGAIFTEIEMGFAAVTPAGTPGEPIGCAPFDVSRLSGLSMDMQSTTVHARMEFVARTGPPNQGRWSWCSECDRSGATGRSSTAFVISEFRVIRPSWTRYSAPFLQPRAR